jgi:hypothetical protein
MLEVGEKERREGSVNLSTAMELGVSAPCGGMSRSVGDTAGIGGVPWMTGVSCCGSLVTGCCSSVVFSGAEGWICSVAKGAEAGTAVGAGFVYAGASLSNSERLADCLGFVGHGRAEVPAVSDGDAGGREV